MTTLRVEHFGVNTLFSLEFNNRTVLFEKVKTGRTGKSGKSTFASFSAFVAFYFFTEPLGRCINNLLLRLSLRSCHNGECGLKPFGPQRLMQALTFLSPIATVKSWQSEGNAKTSYFRINLQN